MNALIAIRDLHKHYLSHTGSTIYALNGINCDLMENTITCLVGVNGAGKTTLSSLVATLHPPTRGSIFYNDKNIYQDVVSFKRTIGYVPQQLFLHNDRTILDLLCLSGYLYGLTQAESTQRAAYLMQLFALTSYAQFTIGQLSGGYKQRVAIARALMHQPRLLILDEPTIGLDPQARKQVLESLHQLRQEGMTILLTTHYLDEVELLADQIIFIHQGKIIAQGTPKDLITQESAQSLESLFIKLIERQ